MRRALAAGLLGCTLAAYAQAPPDAAPAPASQAAPAPSPPEEPAASPAQVPQPSPAVVTQEQAEQRVAHPPAAVRAPVAHPQASPPPPAPSAAAPPHPAAEHDQLITELRAEVNRLQSELDAERAAALQPAEEGAAQQRSAWGWLVVVALVGLAAGFVLGWRLLDRRIRRKYGGLRIY